ncbi:MAG TPA: c-type cytochrome [Bradyrhizobium sp.]|jgi:putative heme-binding domain-containing protein
MFANRFISGMAFTLLASGMAQACDALKPFAGQTAAPSHEQEIDQGRQAFESNCAVCHGMDASGGRGPNLRRARIARAPDENALCDLIEAGIPPEMPAGAFLTDVEVRALVAYVRSLGQSAAAAAAATGDPAHGARVFAANGCSACHVLAGRGTALGPELTDLGDRRSAAYVREVLLDPAARLPEEFLMVRVTTRSGSMVEGIRINEDNYSIQLRDASGVLRSFEKADLKSQERLKGQTPMPSFKTLSPTDVQDLVAYLLAPRSNP